MISNNSITTKKSADTPIGGRLFQTQASDLRRYENLRGSRKPLTRGNVKVVSDGGKLCRLLTQEADQEFFVSSACRFPAQQQAEILPSDRGHRHPYRGPRPQWSGYCVVESCACPCHGAKTDSGIPSGPETLAEARAWDARRESLRASN